MNKKIVFGAVLLGAMTLTSCVDDTESASVTAIRQAKVEQLKSLADLNKANAEAELIQANAYKAAQEAIAAYNEALKAESLANAAYQQAMADYQNARTEIEREEARQAAEQAAVSLERSKAQLETEKNRLAQLDALYEKQLYDNMLKALEAKEAYEAAIKTEDQKKQAKLLALLETYQEENDKLLGLRSTLNSWKMQLAKLEAGLLSPTQSAEMQVASMTRQIESWKDEIEAAQTYIDTYKEDLDYSTAKEKLDQALKDKKDLTKVVSDASQAQQNAYDKTQNSLFALQNSDYKEAIDDLMGISYYDNEGYYQVVKVNTTAAPAAAINNYCLRVYNYDSQANIYTPLFSDNDWKQSKYISDGKIEYYITYESYYNLIGDGVDKLVASYQANIDGYLTDNTATATENLETAQENATAKETALEEAKTREEAYEKAYQKLNDPDLELTQEEREKLQEEVNAYNDNEKVWQAENNLNQANRELSSAINNKNSADNALASAKEKLTEIKSAVATVKKDATANAEAIKAVNADNLAYAQAQVAYSVASANQSKNNDLINALQQIVNGPDSEGNWNIENQIKNKENQIKNLNNNIANYEDQIATLNKLQVVKSLLIIRLQSIRPISKIRKLRCLLRRRSLRLPRRLLTTLWRRRLLLNNFVPVKRHNI